MRIEFDLVKNAANIHKHGMSLSDAEPVLYDSLAVTIEDDSHSHSEQRFVTIGDDGTGRLLVVCYTWREPDIIRLISARAATPQERRQYEGGRR